MNDFPDVSKNDYSSGLSSEDAQNVIKISYSIWNDRKALKDKMLKNIYDHQGVKRAKESDNVIKRSGKLSSTKYEKLSIGRTKIRRLLGEFLEIGFDSNVYVTNKEAVNAKLDKYLGTLALSLAKPQLETVRSMGIPAYKGVKIPGQNDEDAFDPKQFKLDAEIILQVLLNTSMSEENIKLKLYSCLEKFLIVSEAHGKVERLPDGTDTFRPINPLNSIWIEFDNDYFCDETPIKGERRFMSRGALMEEYSDIDDLDTKLDELSKSSEDTDRQENDNTYKSETGYDVIIVQTKSFDVFYEKKLLTGSSKGRTYELSKEDYAKNKKQIKFDVSKGKYEIKKMYRPGIYEIAAVSGADWLLKCEKTESTVLFEGKNGKYYPKYDYKSIVMPKVGGERVSLQTICSKIERVVDQSVYAIKKEMAKPAGNALGINGGALPKGKTISDLIHDIAENNMFGFETAGERNVSGQDVDPKEVFIEANLGTMDRLSALTAIKANMEGTLDSITGINDAREGFTKATSTATATNSNLQASRSATYEIFFLFGLFTKNIIIHLLNKMKSNPAIIYNEGDSLLLSETDIGFLKATKELILYDYGALITDGRRESGVMEKMERFFEFELNATTLRAEDVAKFYQADSFGKAIKVLDEARKEIKIVKEKEAEQESANVQEVEKGKSTRELNKQANELDKIVLKGSTQKEIDDNKAANDAQLNKESVKDHAIAASEQRLNQKHPDGLIEELANIDDQFKDIEV